MATSTPLATTTTDRRTDAVGTVAGLHVFAVKSMGGVSVSSARLTAMGLEGDRRYMVVDQDGVFVSQRQALRLGLMRAKPCADGGVTLGSGDASLTVTPPEGSTCTVSVWDDPVEATDCGDHAAEFISDGIGQRVRLVWFGRAAERPVDPRYALPHDRVAFADGFPVLVLSTAAVVALGARLRAPVDPLRFRANVLLDGVAAHAEDSARICQTDKVRLALVKPCARCVMVDRDPTTLEHDSTVLRELALYRRDGPKVLFGMNATVLSEGQIRVGDPVHLLPG